MIFKAQKARGGATVASTHRLCVAKHCPELQSSVAAAGDVVVGRYLPLEVDALSKRLLIISSY